LKKILLIVLLFFIYFAISSMAADAQSKLGLNEIRQTGIANVQSSIPPAASEEKSDTSSQQNITVLRRDSGTNISEMNIDFAISPTYGSAQAVSFTVPKPDWKLEYILVYATDGWNSSSNKSPQPLPFAIEVRNANLRLLYHFSDTQLPYFTSSNGVRLGVIEVPDLLVNGDFLVCFYGYRSLGLGAEMQNGTGNSYFYDKLTGQTYRALITTSNNQTIPVNWLIRVAGR
jgi:hypothetical protein